LVAKGGERHKEAPGIANGKVVFEYLDHLPLYRQARIYARQGIDLDQSTLADGSEP
jgi:transposase